MDVGGLVDASDEEEMVKSTGVQQGDAQTSCAAQKQMEGEESLAVLQGRFFPAYLTTIITFNLFAAAVPQPAPSDARGLPDQAHTLAVTTP